MRRRSLLIAVPAGLVTPAACGDEDTGSSSTGDSATPEASGTSAPPPPKIVDGPLPAITAGTKFGEKPTVAGGSGEPSKDLAVKTVVAGGGKAIAENDFVSANYLGQIWESAKVFDNSYDRKTPLVIQLAQGSIIDGWRYALAGKKTGSRVQFSRAAHLGIRRAGQRAGGHQGHRHAGLRGRRAGHLQRQELRQGRGSPQDDAALPKVGTNTDGKAPSIELPKADAPKQLVAEYVLEGDGAEVGAENSVLVQYKGVVWDGGKEFDSTYGRKQLTSFSLQQVVKGWSQGLTGKKVGSRVLIVIPPDLGYGDSPPEGSGIEKDSTLVFSVDILAKM